ncbi:MAG: response regulator, partial [Dehalococcoidia bacterium]
MLPPDRKITDAFAQRTPQSGPAHILVVGTDTESLAPLIRLLENRKHRCTRVSRLDDARAAVDQGRFDLVVLNPALPDGDGLELSRQLQESSPWTKTIVLVETSSFQAAIEAMRCGVVDVLGVPVDPDDFISRVDSALLKSWADRQREGRLTRLRRMCDELSADRDEISQQVQTLCNELVAAYQEIAEQIDEVTMATEFRTLLKQELDVEEVLRTALEYVLTKTGPTNAAVFLPDSEGRYGLAAYVNYDCPRESITVLLEHLCQVVCPQMAGEADLVCFDDAEEFAGWVGPQMSFLSGCQVIAFSCRYNGECLAVILLFRSRDIPFDEQLAATLEILRE